VVAEDRATRGGLFCIRRCGRPRRREGNVAAVAEKIITIIHEALHATQWMKNVAAQSGNFQSPVGSAVFRKHEAYVDNIAKAIAKKLGLIPQNYPPTNW
jgi:hypothetical protein